MANVLITAATEIELKAFFPSEFKHGVVNLVSAVLGVGAVASVKLCQLLSHYRFEYVLLVGSCGSKEFSSGVVVAPDCIVSSRGSPNLFLENHVSKLESKKLRVSLITRSTLVEVTNFISEFSSPSNIPSPRHIVYDMEGYSIADVCKRHNVAFGILKIVVDGREDKIMSISDYLQLEYDLCQKRSSVLREITGKTISLVGDLLLKARET